jgi:hypothetical protein
VFEATEILLGWVRRELDERVHASPP